jgi:hypothetical protein
MAGDWIKFDTSTSDKPEVWAIASQLSIDPDAVVGKLLRVWAWFDEQTENGKARGNADGNAISVTTSVTPSVTKALLDRRVGVTGFCDAMIQSGWMSEDDGALGIPNFDRHNGKTAKSRCLTAKRVANHKAGHAKGNAVGNAHGITTSVTDALPREEKRREDSNTHTHTQNGTKRKASRTQPVIPTELAECWSRWIEYHFATAGRAIPPVQAEALLMELGRRGPDKAARDIDFSIRKNAKSILDSDHDFERRPDNGPRTHAPSQKKRNFV